MRSMTGFGRASLEKDSRNYIIEIKSVNHKYNDITVKLPRNLMIMEDKIRKRILTKITRGKIDVYVTYYNFGVDDKKILINKELAKLYIDELRSLAKEANINSDIRVTEISKMPEVLNVENEEDENQITEELLECLDEALNNFINMREEEGKRIKKDLEKRILKVKENVDKISEFSSGLTNEYVVKLRNRIKEILNTDVIDENRLAQEIVIYSDKSSVEEELTRLHSHIEQFKSLIEKDSESIGKKLDFLIQEMNREVNTIGSKSGSLDITNCVIELKTIIEDIREQIQNIE